MTYLTNPGDPRVDDAATVGVFKRVFAEKEVHVVADVERTHKLRI